MRDFDVEAVNAVVLDLEIGDTGALALACLEVDQKRSAMRVDRAKLVELGVEAGRDDAAVADLRGRVWRNRAGEDRCPLRIAVEVRGKRGEKRRFALFLVKAELPVRGSVIRTPFESVIQFPARPATSFQPVVNS